MSDEVMLFREIKGRKRFVTVGIWENGSKTHPKVIYDESPTKNPDDRLELYPATTKKLARAKMVKLAAALRKQGWKDQLTAEENARIKAETAKRAAEYERREAAEKAEGDAKTAAFPRTALDKKLAAAIAKPNGVTSLDLRGSKGNQLSMVPPTIANLKKLRVLLLDGNGLEELPEELDKCKSLEYLSLAHNKLTSMSAAAYLWKLRCLNVHDNKIDVANVGHRQKNFEIQMGGNPIERLGSYPKTHTIGIDAAALFPLDDSSLDNPWPSVRTIHLYGRDATPKERKQVAKWFPKAQLEFIGPVKKGPKIVTKP